MDAGHGPGRQTMLDLTEHATRIDVRTDPEDEAPRPVEEPALLVIEIDGGDDAGGERHVVLAPSPDAVVR